LQLFKACEALGGCIIFLDELDSLATSRDRADMHEASRRLLGVLLREIDGFDNTSVAGSSSSSSSGQVQQQQQQQQERGAASRRSVLIGATNRRQDLDAALLSRWVGVVGRHSGGLQLAIVVVRHAGAVLW
jgi:SpoVK/Ycf46/Vps4 family AAA+-type ATPase